MAKSDFQTQGMVTNKGALRVGVGNSFIQWPVVGEIWLGKVSERICVVLLLGGAKSGKLIAG